MITTVTTTTTTTLTSSAAASLTLIVILLLISLLIQKEVIGNLNLSWAKRLNRVINVAIVPLLAVFVTTVVVKLADVLR